MDERRWRLLGSPWAAASQDASLTPGTAEGGRAGPPWAGEGPAAVHTQSPAPGRADGFPRAPGDPEQTLQALNGQRGERGLARAELADSFSRRWFLAPSPGPRPRESPFREHVWRAEDVSRALGSRTLASCCDTGFHGAATASLALGAPGAADGRAGRLEASRVGAPSPRKRGPPRRRRAFGARTAAPRMDAARVTPRLELRLGQCPRPSPPARGVASAPHLYRVSVSPGSPSSGPRCRFLNVQMPGSRVWAPRGGTPGGRSTGSRLTAACPGLGPTLPSCWDPAWMEPAHVRAVHQGTPGPLRPLGRWAAQSQKPRAAGPRSPRHTGGPGVAWTAEMCRAGRGAAAATLGALPFRPRRPRRRS